MSVGRPGTVDVPGVTGSALCGDVGPIAREPDPGGVFYGGGVVVWAKEAPDISVTRPVTMMRGLSIERTPSTNFGSLWSTLFAGGEFPQIARRGQAASALFFRREVRNKKEGRLVARQAPTVRDEVHVVESLPRA